MKRAFVYKDEKSHKFWTIDYSGSDFAVNYGKYGNAGKYEIKEFDSEEECIREAEKLIRSKLKKGYVEDPAFDFDNRLYFDDEEEIGLHPKTSHPRFTGHFTEDFYYDCSDEEAPFGSDEGHDTLSHFFESMRKNRDLDVEDFPRALIEDNWDMQYLPADTLDEEVVRALMRDKEMDMIQSDMVTYATAFACVKVTGRLSASLRERAIYAIRRLAMMMGYELTPTQNRMIADLSSFECDTD